MGAIRPAQAIAAALREAGGGPVFGLPGGGGNLDLIGTAEEAGLRFVLCHGETAAAIAAATWAEETGLPAACLATRGPGAASLANGLAHALLDRAPLLAITDAIAAGDRARVPHQRLDHARLLAETVKASVPIDADPGATAAWAVDLALAPPPGPVHLDVVAGAPRAPLPPIPARTATPPADLDEARRLVAAARRPVVLAGVGVRGAAGAIERLVAGTTIPVLTTYKAKGLAPPANDAGLLTGGTLELPVLHSADLVIAVGLDPVELIPAPWRTAAPVLSLAAWPANAATFPIACELVGDVPELAAKLGAVAGDWDTAPAAYRAAALERLAVPVAGLDPVAVVQAAAAAAPGGMATVDAGAHMLVAMPYWPGRALISSGLATMGFALPAAIGAALAGTGRRITCLTGDGGLSMCAGELETVARLRLPVTVVVFNDAALSLIEIKQRPSGHGGRAAVRYLPTDWAAVARGFGIEGRRVERADGLAAALAPPAEGPLVVDALVDPSGYPAVLAATRES
jgi:acetolactate synthase-1/2/3 large subunit